MQNYTDDIFNQRFAEMMHLKYGKFPSEVVCCLFLLLRSACISFEGCMRYSASGFMVYKQTCLPQFNEFLQGECYRERVSADFQVSCKVACMNMGEKARGGARIKVGFCKRLWLLRFKKFVVFSRRVFDYIATFYIWYGFHMLISGLLYSIFSVSRKVSMWDCTVRNSGMASFPLTAFPRNPNKKDHRLIVCGDYWVGHSFS